jgi:hypothetical protein
VRRLKISNWPNTPSRGALTLARAERASWGHDKAAIALLDRLDAPAEDLEDGGEWEPWFAAPEGHERQLPWCLGADDDR